MNFHFVSSALIAMAILASPTPGEAAQFRAKSLRIIGLACVISPYGRTAGQMTAVKLGFKNVGALAIKAGKTVVLTGAPFGTLSYTLRDDLQPNDQFSVWDFPIAQKPTSCSASAR